MIFDYLQFEDENGNYYHFFNNKFINECYLFKNQIKIYEGSNKKTLSIDEKSFTINSKKILIDGKKFKKSIVEQKNYVIKTKRNDLNIKLFFNTSSSTIILFINDKEVFNNSHSKKLLAKSSITIEYENYTLNLIRSRLKNEVTTISIKFNNRDAIFATEDKLFLDYYEKFAISFKRVNFPSFLKFKKVELIIIPIVLTILMYIQIFIVWGYPEYEPLSMLLLILGFLIVFLILDIGAILLSYRSNKKKFR